MTALWMPRRGGRSDYRRATGVMLAATVLIASTALLWWFFDPAGIRYLVAGLRPMNPVSAIGFLFASCAVFLLRDARPVGLKSELADALALYLMFIGSTRLLDLVFETTLCPDSWLAATQLPSNDAFAVLIAPNVAVCQMLFSVALLVTDRPRWPGILHPQVLVTPILCTGTAAVIGYVFDNNSFYQISHYPPMAMRSAASLILLSLTLAFSRPDQGYLQLLPRGSVGSRSFVRLLPACILIPALFAGVTALGPTMKWAPGTEISIATAITILGMSALAFFNSVVLNRAENIQHAAEARLTSLVEDLDRQNIELMTEVAERIHMQKEAAHQATHDPLTGLPNRLLFLDRLETALAEMPKKGNSCALLYIDIDRFKPVNDQYGHHAGDELLRAIAQRLQACVRQVDTAARIGGDEFAAIMDGPRNDEQTGSFALQICQRISQPYFLEIPDHGGVEVRIGVSVGIALYPSHARDLDGLVRAADIAMYRAKSRGRWRGPSANIEFAIRS